MFSLLVFRVFLTCSCHICSSVCGIPDDKLVEAHGSFATASCHLCYTPYPSEEAKVCLGLQCETRERLHRFPVLETRIIVPAFLSQRAIMNDSVPICTFCAATVKPDVVFFGEDLPQKYFLHTKDFPKADLLIIMGTSLQVNIQNIFNICLFIYSVSKLPCDSFCSEFFESILSKRVLD